MLKIKKKDKVLVITGKHKKQIGIVSKIIKTYDGKTERKLIILEGLNLIKKHTKSNPNKEKSGGIITKEAPVDISNIIILNEITNKKDKIKFKIDNKKKCRVLKSNNEVLK
ncbi:MAG TPA: 50S ribosomal protein L24 [Candidatus Azoamicus sp. MARI]